MRTTLAILLVLITTACGVKREKVEMVFVEGGQFLMGDICCYANRKPVRRISLGDFCIGKYPITVEQFAKFIEQTNYITDAEKGHGSTILNGETWETLDSINWRHSTQGKILTKEQQNIPVVHVSWNDAMAYCSWLSKITKKNYRLPTEAEWEYAAHGGKKHSHNLTRFSGSNSIDSVGWYIGNTTPDDGVQPVGLKNPNSLGIYDMTGNVWEWCSDWYGSPYIAADTINPQGPAEGKRKVGKGGSWRTPAEPQSHITHRSSLNPEKQGNLLGFRVACNSCCL